MEDEQQAKASRAKQANRNSLVEICRSITKLRHELAPREWATEELLVGMSLMRPRERCFGLCLRDVKYIRIAREKAGLGGRAKGPRSSSKVARL